jgi:hypothetical protein
MYWADNDFASKPRLVSSVTEKELFTLKGGMDIFTDYDKVLLGLSPKE